MHGVGTARLIVYRAGESWVLENGAMMASSHCRSSRGQKLLSYCVSQCSFYVAGDELLCRRSQGQGPPLRIPNGIHRNRLSLILAVLTKHAKLRLHSVDCHTNVVGGLTLTEPATDLAVALAIASSYFDRPIACDVAAIGEIGAWFPNVAGQNICTSLCDIISERSD